MLALIRRGLGAIPYEFHANYFTRKILIARQRGAQPRRERAVMEAKRFTASVCSAKLGGSRQFIGYFQSGDGAVQPPTFNHPATLGEVEVGAFLSYLAVELNIAAATQNQALASLLFLYKQVMDIELPWLDTMVRAKRPVRLPVVLSSGEVRLHYALAQSIRAQAVARRRRQRCEALAQEPGGPPAGLRVEYVFPPGPR